VTDAWIVGGALRDELLGRPVRDIDVAVAGDPEQAARARAAEVRGPVFQLSEAFGAWRVIDRRTDTIWDFSPLQGATIEEDLAQRDFTINAIARPLDGGELIDPADCRFDLETGTLRVVGPQAFERDPLRTLRLPRFAAELGFTPDAETERLARASAARLSEATGERIYLELRRLMVADGALAGLQLADRLGVLETVLPEVSALHGIEQSDYHHLDVYDHTLEVLKQQIQLEGRLGELFDEPERV
jgi:poly(A) polymerase